MQLSGGFVYPIDVYTDCYSLYQVILNENQPNPSDPSSTLWLKWLKEQYQSESIRGCGWCSTVDMPGDGLTKPLAGQAAIRRLMAGRMRFQYASLCDGVTLEAHKGLPPAKKEQHVCTAHWVQRCQTMIVNQARTGGFAWWLVNREPGEPAD